MRIFFLFVVFFLSAIIEANAQSTPYRVTGIKVAATADSAAKAREDAINQGYVAAYEKLKNTLEEQGKIVSKGTPSLADLMGMVTDFSIDHEKNSAISYTASLSFQFDPSVVGVWLAAASPSSLPENQASHPIDPLSTTTEEVRVFVPVKNLADLQRTKQVLGKISEARSVDLRQLTTQGALLTIHTRMPTDQIQEKAKENHIPLVFQ